jgi:trimeric autotransporter adhesin
MGIDETRRGVRRGRRRRWTSGTLALALLVAVVPAAAAVDGNLPGGTAIEVSITGPADDLVLEVDAEDATREVTVTGTAALGGTAVTKNTTLVYILDLSGSMTSTAGVDCTGNGSNDNRLVCQREAVAHVNGLAAAPGSPVGFTGVGTYSGSGTGRAHVVDRVPGGDALLVAPDHDGDGNGTADLVDVVSGFRASGTTSFSDGLDAALTLMEASTTPVNRIVYISDGVANTGTRVTDYAGRFDGFGTTRIDTFAITSGSGCANGTGGSYGSLDEVAALTPGGSCTEVKDLDDLARVLGQVVTSELVRVAGSIDGGEPVELATDPVLPLEGPAAVDVTWPVGELGVGAYELCLTAHGTDGGGAGSVEDCRTVTVRVPLPDEERPGSEVLDGSTEREAGEAGDGGEEAEDEPAVLGETVARPAQAVRAQPTYTG